MSRGECPFPATCKTLCSARYRVSETTSNSCHSSEVRRFDQSAARTERIHFCIQLCRYSVACDYVWAPTDILLASKHVPFSNEYPVTPPPTGG